MPASAAQGGQFRESLQPAVRESKRPEKQREPRGQAGETHVRGGEDTGPGSNSRGYKLKVCSCLVIFSLRWAPDYEFI